MKLQQLKFLVAVVDYGGVIKAAEHLHISQPSISAGLKALEAELGGSLFDRSIPSNRPLRLNSAGRRFYQRALEILSQCESARADFSGNDSGKMMLRLGVLDTLSRQAVANVFHFISQRESHLKLNIWEGSSRRVTEWFSQKRLDVIWTNVNDLTPNAQVVWREPLVAVLPPSHFLSQMTTISIRDLAQQPFIHRSRCELDAVGKAQLKAAGTKLDVRVRAEREDMAFQLIRAGAGITLAPKSLVPSDLVGLKVAGLNIERSIGLQWQEEIDITLLSTLKNAIQEAMGNLQY